MPEVIAGLADLGHDLPEGDGILFFWHWPQTELVTKVLRDRPDIARGPGPVSRTRRALLGRRKPIVVRSIMYAIRVNVRSFRSQP